MHFAIFTARAPFVTKNHQSNGYAMSPTSSETSVFRARCVTKPRHSRGYLRAAQWLAILLLLLTCSVMALAQTGGRFGVDHFCFPAHRSLRVVLDEPQHAPGQPTD